MANPGETSAELLLRYPGIRRVPSPRLELFDLYLSRTGWQAVDALMVITVVLSAFGSLLWWIVARALYALVLRVIRGPAAAR